MVRNRSHFAVISIFMFFLIAACGGSKYPPIQYNLDSPKTLFGKNFYFYTGVEKDPSRLLGKRACEVLSDKKCNSTNDTDKCTFIYQGFSYNRDSDNIFPSILTEENPKKQRGADILAYERLDPNDPPDIDNNGKAIKWCNSGNPENSTELQSDLRSVVAKVDASREICMPIHGYSYTWIMTFDSLLKMTGDVNIALGLIGLSGNVSANYKNTSRMKILITAFFREKREPKHNNNNAINYINSSFKADVVQILIKAISNATTKNNTKSYDDNTPISNNADSIANKAFEDAIPEIALNDLSRSRKIFIDAINNTANQVKVSMKNNADGNFQENVFDEEINNVVKKLATSDKNEAKNEDDFIDTVYVGHMSVHVFEGREDAKDIDISFSSGASSSILAKFSDETRFTEVHRTTYFAGVIGYSMADISEVPNNNYYCNKAYRLVDNAVKRHTNDEKLPCSLLLDDMADSLSFKQNYHDLLTSIRNINDDNGGKCNSNNKENDYKLSCYHTCQILNKAKNILINDKKLCKTSDFNVYDFSTVSIGLEDDNVCRQKEPTKEK